MAEGKAAEEKETVELQMYGRPDERDSIELVDGECAYCTMVERNVKLENVGDTVYVHRVDDPTGSIRLIEVIGFVGPSALVGCHAVTVEEVEQNLKEARLEEN